jgi:hypothetical protein
MLVRGAAAIERKCLVVDDDTDEVGDAERLDDFLVLLQI